MSTINSDLVGKPVVSSVPTGGLLWYKLDNATITDTWNGYTGTNNGSAIQSTVTKYGGGAAGTFTSSKYVSLPAIPFTKANGLSVALWVYPTGANSGNDVKVFELDKFQGVHVWSNRGTNITTYNFCDIIGFTLTLNTWTHVVCTITSAGAGAVYLNGSTTATGTSTSLSSYYPSTDTSNATIVAGSTVGRSFNGSHDPFKGYIDEFQLYNKILSGTEITAAYNNTP